MFENDNHIIDNETQKDDFFFNEEVSEVEDTEIEETDETLETEEISEEPKEELTEANQAKVDEIKKMQLKYNHETIEVDDEEARTLAQLGLFYQRKVKDSYDNLNSTNARMEKLAKEYGYSNSAEMLETLEIQRAELLAEENGTSVIEEYKNIQNAKVEEEQSIEMEKTKQTELMFNEFLTNFSRDDIDKISPETWEKVNNGANLSMAYLQQQNNDLMKQLNAERQSTSNKSKAVVGSVTKHGGAEPPQEEDLFLKGFNK